jgi:hypothetical protein
MAIGDDFEIQNDKDIRAVSGSTNYTVLELHRWLQDRADDASASGDDYMDITRDTPSDKSFDTIINLINGYNIDDATAQRLYGGSIIQSGGDVIYDGIQVLAPAGMHLEIIQNGALATNFWTTGLNADAANGISHRFMLKVRTAAADIDGRRLLGITREWGKTYLEFGINGTARGVNVMAFTGWADDLNNTTVIGSMTGSPYNTVSNTTAGYNGIDVNNDTADEYYYSEWNRGSASINQFYERIKYLTRRGETTTLYGIQGQLFRGITHEINIDGGTGTWDAVEAVTWSGGTGQMLAINNLTATSATKMWIQLLTGVPPTDNQTLTGASSGATNLVNATVTARTVSTPVCGVSTGSSIIGAFGFGIEALDLSASDKVFDLTNTQRQAPNYVTFTVGGIVSGEDYVLVGPASGGALDLDQFTLNGALTGATVTSVVVNGSIPNDTPATGTIRIARANGAYTRHPYSAWSGSTFTITSHDFSSNNAANGANCYISYIDKLAAATSEAFTVVFVSNRDLFIRVRDGGASPIKTFESTGTLTSGGGSATAVRTSDA